MAVAQEFHPLLGLDQKNVGPLSREIEAEELVQSPI